MPSLVSVFARSICLVLLAATACSGQNREWSDATGANPPSTSSATGGGSTNGSTLSFDVVIVGAGSGGIAAALQAARLGASVALVEETDWIGGQMTAAAVSTMDGGGAPPAGTGIYDEFKQHVLAYYADPVRFPPSGKSVHTCYSGPSVCFEPSVGQTIVAQMIADANITLMTRSSVASVLRQERTVTGIVLADGRQLDARVVVDATEDGDVLPLAGAHYRVGNSDSGAVNPSACIQSLTYLAVIKRYANGVPSDLRIASPPPGYDALRPSFASIVASGGSDTTGYPVSWPRHNRYRGLPDTSNPTSYTNDEADLITKTGVNWANDWPGYSIVTENGVQKADWHGTLPVGYLEDRAQRRSTDCAAKLATLAFVYYAQIELGADDWSVADDEGFDTAFNTQDNACEGFPAELRSLEQRLALRPYVRESRRIAAVHTLTAKEIRRAPGITPANAVTSIAVGDYGTDLHNCNDDASLEAALGETAADASTQGGPFQVPFEALVPETLDGLLAAEKNIGVTRLAAGAIRLQPITMATGQAVGAIAAIAARAGVAPRDVDPLHVQLALLAAGSALALHAYDDAPPASTIWTATQLVDVRGIMAGETGTHFGVADPLARAGAATAVAQLFHLDVSNPPAVPTFQDVLPTDPAYAAIEAIHAAGYTVGCSSSPPLFCPAQPITRSQLAVFLGKGLGIDPKAAPMQPLFDDVPATDPRFGFIQTEAQAGILAGCSSSPPQFCPDDAATRGEMALAALAVLSR